MADSRLRRAITRPKIQQPAEEMVRLALRALDDTKHLEQSLYERFVESRTRPQEPEAAAASMRALWESTFSGLAELLAYLQTIIEEPAAEDDDATIAAHMDFGDLEAMDDAPLTSGSLELGEGDIGDLLEGLDEGQQSEPEKWAEVLGKVSSIEYGLRSQHHDAASRFEIALASGDIAKVLGVLDDAASATTEGVHAVIAAVYTAFVPDVDPATVVPKYLTALGRALFVRRGLAELARPLDAYNAVLQDPASTAEHGAALEAIRALMRTFVGSPVCQAMRPADRVQIEELESELRRQPPSAARLTSEGLVKYLESLTTINQREVLVQHDRRALEEMRESMSNARQLFDLSRRTARDMLDRAFDAAQRLRGRNPATDDLLTELERAWLPEANPHQLLARLDALLAIAGG